MARVFILDNVDSFTFNLAQAFMKLGAEVRVERDGEMICSEQNWRPTHLVLSPGPLRPTDHPANFALLDAYAGRVPILGVCLGMQAINEWCGGTLRRDTPPMHGKTSEVRYETGSPLFDGLPNPFMAARYHSLVVDRLGEGMQTTAWVVQGFTVPRFRCSEVNIEHRNIGTSEQVVMAFVHKAWPLFGVQFHPESYLTPEGERILDAFLNLGSSPK